MFKAGILVNMKSKNPKHMNFFLPSQARAVL